MESSLLSLHAVYPSLLNPKFPRISFPPSDSKAGFSSSSIPLLNPYFSFPIFTISVSLSYISLSTSNQQHQSPNLNSGVCFPSPSPQTHISSLPRCFPMLVSAREGEVPMYLSEKPLPAPIDFYKEEGGRDMLVEIVGNGVIHPQSHQQLILGESSGEDHELRAPKKRAETWVQEEIRCLINLRIEMDSLFNTSKSNRHLWEQISSTMRDKGFDRSPTMCTDKWRNLLKEYKKTKHQERGALSAKMSYFKELEELLRERSKNVPCKSPTLSKVDPFIHFTDKGLEDTNIPFGQAEGGDSNSYGGRIITVKWGDFTRRIGIDGTADAIKEAIKSAFGLRTQRAFWLEDEDEVIRSLDRDMPVGTYTLHLDDGITIKVCFYDESDRIPVRTEEKTLYTEDDFRRFLSHRGWVGLRELSGFRSVDTMDELRPGGLYQGVRMLGD